MTQSETPIPAPPAGEEGTTAPAAPTPEAGSPAEVRVKLFARTDVGQVREHNEDNFLVADLAKKTRGLLEANRVATVGPQGMVFAVCDGMGGAAAGEIASQLAVDIIYERMAEGLEGRPAPKRDELARRLVRAVESAGLRIFQEAKADRTRRGMGTTVTAAALMDDHIFFAQVGDSRGYILRGETLVQVTRDQSLVNQLIEAGQLTEEEAETFEHNNIILQALGTSDTVQVDLTFVELLKGDTLMLCSDGLSGMVRFEEIREVLRGSGEPLDICKALTERANQAGGHDNITVICARFDGEGLKVAAEPNEPLKYRKYALPEEVSENTEPNRRVSSGSTPVAQPSPAAQPSNPPTATDGTTLAPPATADAKPASLRPRNAQGEPWQEAGPHSDYSEERIDIPGTHVPAWVVVAIVVGVVALLAASAFFLMR